MMLYMLQKIMIRQSGNKYNQCDSLYNCLDQGSANSGSRPKFGSFFHSGSRKKFKFTF